jgi:hypothetical protein
VLGLALVATGVLAAWWDLFRSDRGHACVHHLRNGRAIAFLVRRNTWLNILINPGRPGWHAGIAVGRVVHLGIPIGQSPSGWLLAHEVAHLLRQEGQVTRYLLSYICSPAFRAAEEVACNAWADEHATEFEPAAQTLSTMRRSNDHHTKGSGRQGNR